MNMKIWYGLQTKGKERCRLLLIVILVFGFGWQGCATTPPGYQPLAAEGMRLKYPGYSVVAPPGEGWLIKENDYGLVAITKKIKSNTHTFFMNVTPVRVTPNWNSPEDFMTAIKREKDLNVNPKKRLKLLVNDYRLKQDVGEYCFEFHQKAEDYGVSRTDGAPFLILSVKGLGCNHPQERELYFDVSYSERNKPGEADPELEKIGASFLKSFRFENLS